MRVTTKGQVTIAQHIREKLGITPATEVDLNPLWKTIASTRDFILTR